ncbi:MAG: M48 family metallopeptidase [Fibromonadaceae bacterium]|jgi:heat shock protein HtpX|nr:M48 family metallopeptidase [Fibromonadaceae bacterium]
MKYVGIATQQASNNRKSVMLLLAFPLLMFALLYAGCYILAMANEYDVVSLANSLFFSSAPFVAVAILLWFIIAYFANVYIIDKATGAQTLQRKENKRVYNLVENLCISCGMTMPKVHVIEDSALNAFASGVSQKSYTITLTRGIIDTLDDKELEGVIAHELLHIRNNDVRVLVISIVFVGIFAMLGQISMRLLVSSGRRAGRNRNNAAGALLIMLLVVALVSIGYGISMLMRFAISRKREYMADAGAASLTKDPGALASALRKVSGNSVLQKEQCESIAQLFIEHKQPKKGIKAMFSGLFATHPPIEKRIATLEQF